jgi:O-antigen ligase
MINYSISYCYISGVFLLICIILSHLVNRKKPQFSLPFLVFLPFIISTLISTIYSIEPMISLKDNKELFIFLMIPIFILILTTKKRLMMALYAVLASTFLSAIIGLFRIIQKWDINTDDRLKGLTSHWMTYSGLLMLVFIFFTIYFFLEKRKNTKITVLVLISFILIAILFSLTRSVWIGILISLGIFFLYYKPRIIKYIIPFLIFVLILLPSPVKSRIASIFDLSNDSNRDRILMYQIGFNIFKDYPLVGVGCNNIPRVYEANIPEKLIDKQKVKINMHLHNNFLHLLAERGILTLLSFLFAFIYIIKRMIAKISRGDKDLKFVYLGSLFVILGFLTAGLFEYNFGDTEVLFMLLFFTTLPFLKLKEKVDDN